MRKSFWLAMFLVAGLVACNKETFDTPMDSIEAVPRTVEGINMELITGDGNTVYTNCSKVAVNNVSGSNFTVTLNPGTLNAQVFIVQSMKATHNENGLKVAINPGPSQNVYQNKNVISVTAANSVVTGLINPGSIPINAATSIVIEEMDGI